MYKMKKITLLISGLVLSTIVSTTSAQQLSNNGFEDGWGDCAPWTSNNNTSTIGTTPGSWTIAQVIGMGGTGKTVVGEETTGHNSTKAVKLYNSPNSVKASQIVPGYVTLGTTWSTAQGTSASNPDGGTFGGVEFKFKPDAVSFWYTRSHGTTKPDEQATVVAYLWKGTYSQASVPGNIGLLSTKKVTMTDRDRNILDMSTAQGGKVSKTSGAARLAKIDYALQGDASDWTKKVIDFTYEAGAASETPEKFNIIFAAGDYWSTSPGKDNTLCVDDVKLLYYSRLESLSGGGYEVPVKDVVFNQDGVCNCVAYVANPTNPEYTFLGGAPTKTDTWSNDKENNIYSIIVTNNTAGETATDFDGKKSHTYNVKYMSQTIGYAAAFDNGIPSSVSSPIPVDYMKEADGTYALTFGNDKPDFEFEFDDAKGTRTPSRTVITGVTMTVDSEGCYVFTKDGATQGRDYTVSLVNDGDTKCIYDPKGDGRWIFNFDVNYDGNVTRVTVTNDVTLSGVNGMNSMKERVVARSGAIEVSGFDGVAEVYTIDGRLVAKTAVAGNAQIAASNGIYLVRTPNTVKKVIVR